MNKEMEVHIALQTHEWIEFVKDWGLEPEFRNLKKYNMSYERRVCKICGLVECRPPIGLAQTLLNIPWIEETDIFYIHLARMFGNYVLLKLKDYEKGR